MRKLLTGALLLALPLFAACTSSTTNQPAPATPGANTVLIQNNQFTPNPLTVKAGDMVTFTNYDATAPAHTATADDRSFDTGSIGPGGKSAQVRLAKAGTYDYHCNLHPTEKGRLIVE